MVEICPNMYVRVFYNYILPPDMNLDLSKIHSKNTSTNSNYQQVIDLAITKLIPVTHIAL